MKNKIIVNFIMGVISAMMFSFSIVPFIISMGIFDNRLRFMFLTSLGLSMWLGGVLYMAVIQDVVKK